MTHSHVASLIEESWMFFLRGEERVYRNRTPGSPLRSGSMLFPFNYLKTDRKNNKEKEARKRQKTPKLYLNSTESVVMTKCRKNENKYPVFITMLQMVMDMWYGRYIYIMSRQKKNSKTYNTVFDPQHMDNVVC